MLAPDITTLTSTPWRVCDLVKLTKPDEDGVEEPVLCWLVGGEILVHSARLELFKTYVLIADNTRRWQELADEGRKAIADMVLALEGATKKVVP